MQKNTNLKTYSLKEVEHYKVHGRTEDDMYPLPLFFNGSGIEVNVTGSELWIDLEVDCDVAARGLDVDNLTHIISYSLPDDNAVYNHRSGRTGRAGKTGVSIAIIHSRERNKLRDIEKHIGKAFERCEVPKPKAIIEKQLFNLADRLEKVEVKESDIAEFLPPVLKKLSWLDSEDLLKRLLSLEFNRLLEYYQGAPELDYVPEKEKEKRKKATYDKTRGAQEKDRRTAEEGYERVFVNAGKADGFFAPTLIDLINKNTHGERVELGRIDLLTNYSLFDVKAGDAKRVVRALNVIKRKLFIAEPINNRI